MGKSHAAVYHFAEANLHFKLNQSIYELQVDDQQKRTSWKVRMF